MEDKWCKPIIAKSGNRVSGGAARNVRIAAFGGMEPIISSAVEFALQQADLAARAQRQPALRLVRNAR